MTYWELVENHSAIGNEVSSGEIARIVRGEKRHSRSDFLWFSRTTKWGLQYHLRPESVDLFFAQANLASEWRFDESRADDIDTDTTARELGRKRTPQRTDCGFN